MSHCWHHCVVGANPTDTGLRGGPSRAWYWVGGVLLAVAILGGILTVFSAISRTLDRVRDFQRIDIPGAADIRLNRAGSYTIYYEGPGIDDSDDEDALPSLEVRMQRLEDSSFVPLRQYHGRFTYHLKGHHGAAIFTFRSPAPGTYRIQSRADLAPGRAQLAVGRSITGGILRDALLAGMFCFLAFVAGVVVLVVTAVRRYQARRPPKPIAAPYPPYAPPPPRDAPPPPSRAT